MALKRSAQKYFSLPDHQNAENLILAFWFVRKGKKTMKANFQVNL